MLCNDRINLAEIKRTENMNERERATNDVGTETGVDARTEPTKFNTLPLEMRRLVWGEASNLPRVIMIDVNNYNGWGWSNSPPPPILQVCSETREVALKSYKSAFSPSSWSVRAVPSNTSHVEICAKPSLDPELRILASSEDTVYFHHDFSPFDPLCSHFQDYLRHPLAPTRNFDSFAFDVVNVTNNIYQVQALLWVYNPKRLFFVERLSSTNISYAKGELQFIELPSFESNPRFEIDLPKFCSFCTTTPSTFEVERSIGPDCEMVSPSDFRMPSIKRVGIAQGGLEVNIGNTFIEEPPNISEFQQTLDAVSVIATFNGPDMLSALRAASPEELNVNSHSNTASVMTTFGGPPEWWLNNFSKEADGNSDISSQPKDQKQPACFDSLPTEIRQKIWNEVVTRPKLFQLEIFEDFVSDEFWVTFPEEEVRLAASTFHTCYESRRLATKILEPALVLSAPWSPNNYRSRRMILPMSGNPRPRLFISPFDTVYFHLVDNPHRNNIHPYDVQTVQFKASAITQGVLKSVAFDVAIFTAPVLRLWLFLHALLWTQNIEELIIVDRLGSKVFSELAWTPDPRFVRWYLRDGMEMRQEDLFKMPKIKVMGLAKGGIIGNDGLFPVDSLRVALAVRTLSTATKRTSARIGKLTSPATVPETTSIHQQIPENIEEVPTVALPIRKRPFEESSSIGCDAAGGKASSPTKETASQGLSSVTTMMLPRAVMLPRKRRCLERSKDLGQLSALDGLPNQKVDDSCELQEPEPEFVRFLELRLMSWEAVCHIPRVLPLKQNKRPNIHRRVAKIEQRSKNPTPIAFRICQGSRGAAIKVYSLVFDSHMFQSHLQEKLILNYNPWTFNTFIKYPEMHFNNVVDTVYFSTKHCDINWGVYTCYNVPIRSVAFDVQVLFDRTDPQKTLFDIFVRHPIDEIVVVVRKNVVKDENLSGELKFVELDDVADVKYGEAGVHRLHLYHKIHMERTHTNVMWNKGATPQVFRALKQSVWNPKTVLSPNSHPGGWGAENKSASDEGIFEDDVEPVEDEETKSTNAPIFRAVGIARDGVRL
ncbi:hypothetical protein G7Y89_g493 [Cudoniella acicularis]|uniref:2EXR domain-containing protein n=1 Tax=Cudoniella acicularis TaxID=354080 RepID=A0A8H4RX31_9HELO|nr:hypothetical protein G7Y89_g493 [Cudoniella acicularis]